APAGMVEMGGHGGGKVSETAALSRFLRWLPGLETLRNYKDGWLRHDAVAGVVLATMLVPSALLMRKHRVCPESTASMRLSSRSSPMPCLARAGSWYSGLTPHLLQSFSGLCFLCPGAARRARQSSPAPWPSSLASSAFSRVSHAWGSSPISSL